MLDKKDPYFFFIYCALHTSQAFQKYTSKWSFLFRMLLLTFISVVLFWFWFSFTFNWPYSPLFTVPSLLDQENQKKGD